jgi:two-component system chemotaxis response regulator CheB
MRTPYDLIVMGASWGGLEAIQQVLRDLPPDFSVPIAIAQHRAAESRSGVAPLLARRTAHDVVDAGDKDPIEPGRVYIAPADYHLLVEHGSLALSIDDYVQHSRPSIDVLFESAADVYGERLVAVILTGMNEDGAHGIARVHQRGGCTIAQDPATAARPSMPQAAIDTGCVDRIVALDQISSLLVELTGAERGAAA